MMKQCVLWWRNTSGQGQQLQVPQCPRHTEAVVAPLLPETTEEVCPELSHLHQTVCEESLWNHQPWAVLAAIIGKAPYQVPYTHMPSITLYSILHYIFVRVGIYVYSMHLYLKCILYNMQFIEYMYVYSVLLYYNLCIPCVLYIVLSDYRKLKIVIIFHNNTFFC